MDALDALYVILDQLPPLPQAGLALAVVSVGLPLIIALLFLVSDDELED